MVQAWVKFSRLPPVTSHSYSELDASSRPPASAYSFGPPATPRHGRRPKVLRFSGSRGFNGETQPETRHQTRPYSPAGMAAGRGVADGSRGPVAVVGGARRHVGGALGRDAWDAATRHGTLEPAVGGRCAHLPLHVPRGAPGGAALLPR